MEVIYSDLKSWTNWRLLFQRHLQVTYITIGMFQINFNWNWIDDYLLNKFKPFQQSKHLFEKLKTTGRLRKIALSKSEDKHGLYWWFSYFSDYRSSCFLMEARCTGLGEFESHRKLSIWCKLCNTNYFQFAAAIL